MPHRFTRLLSAAFLMASFGAIDAALASSQVRPVVPYHSGRSIAVTHANQPGPIRPTIRTAAGGVRQELAKGVLKQSYALLGTRYAWGGETVRGGFDCSGFVGYVFRNKAGISLPRTSREIVQVRAPKVGRKDLRPGDVLFFNRHGRGQVSHVGIYAGNNRFIHAPNKRKGGVRVDSLSNDYWSHSYVQAKRVLAMAPGSVARN